MLDHRKSKGKNKQTNKQQQQQQKNYFCFTDSGKNLWLYRLQQTVENS